MKSNSRIGILRTSALEKRAVTVECDAGRMVISFNDVATSDAVPTSDEDFEAEIEKVCATFPGNPEELQRFKLILQRNASVFAKEDDLGCVTDVVHTNPTIDDEAVQLPFRRILRHCWEKSETIWTRC